MKPVLTYTLLGSFGAMFVILVLEELGLTLPLWVYMTLPAIIFTATLGRSLKSAALCSAVSVVLLVSFYYCPWPSRRHFLHDLKRIEGGMTIEEVKAIMKNYHEGTGWPAIYGSPMSENTLSDLGSGNLYQTTTNSEGELVLQNCLVYRHDLGEADWGIIEFKSNRVTGVSFSPD